MPLDSAMREAIDAAMPSDAVSCSQTESTRYRWVLLFGVWLIYFCFGLMIASIAPLVAPIGADLGIGPAAMGAIMGAWPLVYIGAAIPCGILLDRYGARAMLLAAALIMAASGLARSLAQGPEQLFLAIALFGVGGPLISVGAPRLIARWFHGPSRGTAMGFYISGPSLGSICSLTLTNSVMMPATGGDWRAVLMIYSGMVALGGLVWLGIASTPAAGRRRGADGEGKRIDLGAFAEILRLGEVRLILLMSIGVFFINHGLNNWLPELLRDRGLDAVRAGYWAAIPTAVGVIGALFIPRLAIPERRLLIMALLIAGVLCATLLLQTRPGPPLVLGLTLQGLARGSMMSIAILILMETPRVPPERLGLAAGMFFTTAEIGGVLGPLSMGFWVDVTGGFSAGLINMSVVALALLGIIRLLATVRPARS